MTTASCIEFECRDGVGLIWLNDAQTLNALDPPMVDALNQAMDELVPQSRCLLLAGRGRAFSSGARLGGDAVATAEAVAWDKIDLGDTLETHFNPLMDRLRALPIPLVTAVRGAAAGVGCSIALAGDLIIAADSAYFLQAFSHIGLVPDGGSSYLLARTIGRVRALEMMLLGERLPAATARDWGLITRVVPDADLDSAAFDLAQRLARGPTRSFGMIRRLAWQGCEASWDQTLAEERRVQREAGRTQAFREGLTAFLDKRSPEFSGN